MARLNIRFFVLIPLFVSINLWQANIFAMNLYDNRNKEVHAKAYLVNNYRKLSFNLTDTYITGSVGLSSMNDLENKLFNQNFQAEKYLTDKGQSVALAFGQKIYKNRIELEFLQNQVSLDEYINQDGMVTRLSGSDISSQSLFVNLYWDFNTPRTLTPYFGLGLGVAKIKLNDKSVNQFASKNVMSGQFKFGASFPLSYSTDLLMGYRYVSTNKFTLSSNNQEFRFGGLGQNIIEIGIRYSF